MTPCFEVRNTNHSAVLNLASARRLTIYHFLFHFVAERTVWSEPAMFAISSASFGCIYSTVKPHCWNFRIITAFFQVSKLLGFLRHHAVSYLCSRPWLLHQILLGLPYPTTLGVYLHHWLWKKETTIISINMGQVMRKRVLCHTYANNKGADQPAHLRSLFSAFVVRCLDSIIPLISISEISSL